MGRCRSRGKSRWAPIPPSHAESWTGFPPHRDGHAAWALLQSQEQTDCGVTDRGVNVILAC